MLSILRKLKKNEDNRRGGAICNYATIWGILFSLYREFLPRISALRPSSKSLAGEYISASMNSTAHGNFESRGACLQCMCLGASASHLRRWEFVVVLGWLFWVICFVLSFVVRFDFYLQGGLFISLFDIEIRSQTHKVGGTWRVTGRWRLDRRTAQ